MRLVAVERITYANKTFQPGEEFDAEELHGRLLSNYGKVRQLAAENDSPPPAKPMTTDNTSALVSPLRTKGRYKRRDMRSED